MRMRMWSVLSLAQEVRIWGEEGHRSNTYHDTTGHFLESKRRTKESIYSLILCIGRYRLYGRLGYRNNHINLRDYYNFFLALRVIVIHVL